MNNPLVSVIIPNYCHAKYLDQRIQTVLGQTYKNFEVIILDDASPDNGASKTVIEKYRDNPHVSHIVYNEQNSGSTFKQWNKGLKLAKGELVWIAESDDYCELTFLEKLTPYFKNCICVVFCDSQYVDENGKKTPPIFSHSEKIEYYRGCDFIRRKMLKGNSIYNASSALFRLDCALSLESEYMEYRAGGDRLFWIEMAEIGDVVHVSSPFNFFRQHQNNVTPINYGNGVAYREAYKTVRYLEKKGHVRFLEHLSIRNSYLEKISNTSFCDEGIRTSLMKLWSYNGILHIKVMRYFLNVYYKVAGRYF